MDGLSPTVPVILGPTAAGKTQVALALGELWPVVVVSADSRQVYRKLDIGTAKPTPEERERVPHVGIDLIDPGERYSAGRFAADATGWLRAICPDRQPVVVGGTGLYIRALAEGLFREPPMDADRRDRFRQWARRSAGLGSWAARLDPEYSGGGCQRAARVVEVVLLTGRPLSWWQRRGKQARGMRPWYVQLALPRLVLHRRIEARVERMLATGWIDEVAGLIASGVAADAPGLSGVGYREIVGYLEGGMDRSELSASIAASTRQYAKRQITWFRHQLRDDPVVTLDAADAPGTLARRIVQLWKERRA